MSLSPALLDTCLLYHFAGFKVTCRCAGDAVIAALVTDGTTGEGKAVLRVDLTNIDYVSLSLAALMLTWSGNQA